MQSDWIDNAVKDRFGACGGQSGCHNVLGISLYEGLSQAVWVIVLITMAANRTREDHKILCNVQQDARLYNQKGVLTTLYSA
jgi:hypothetical protein